MRVVLLLLLLLGLGLQGAQADITSNLEAWYKMDEGTGTATTADSTANGHTATLVNSPGWVTGKIGAFALSFNGTTQRVTVPDQANLSFTAGGGVDTAFSLGAWLNITAIATQQGLLAKNSGSGAEWLLFTSGSNLFLNLYNNAGSNIGRFGALTTGAHQAQWICLTATYSGSKTAAGIKLYINGTQMDTGNNNSGTYTGQVDTAAVVEFGAYNVGTNLYAGSMDEVRIWRRELSAADVSEFCAYTGAAAPTRRRRAILY
jgi:hypothetical protein